MSKTEQRKKREENREYGYHLTYTLKAKVQAALRSAKVAK